MLSDTIAARSVVAVNSSEQPTKDRLSSFSDPFAVPLVALASMQRLDLFGIG